MIDHFGIDNASAILTSVIDAGSKIAERAKRYLSIKEQIGLKLLGLTPDQQEMIIAWKGSEKNQ
jgi:hypothetical protein